MSYAEVQRILHQVLPAAVAGAFLDVFQDVANADNNYAARLQAVYDGAETIKQAAIQNAKDTGVDLFS